MDIIQVDKNVFSLVLAYLNKNGIMSLACTSKCLNLITYEIMQKEFFWKRIVECRMKLKFNFEINDWKSLALAIISSNESILDLLIKFQCYSIIKEYFKVYPDRSTNKILVLDIDESISHSYMNNTDIQPEILNNERFYQVKIQQRNDKIKFWGVKRPYLDEFLTFCNKYFEKIIIWSAGNKTYVEDMVNILFKNYKRPDLILTRENITYDGINYYKPISAVCQAYNPPLDEKLIIFIDDRNENFKENIKNGICIPSFEPKPEYSYIYKDECLIKLINWFMSDETRNATDVRNLDKSRIFL
jgi:hypothetical protein